MIESEKYNQCGIIGFGKVGQTIARYLAEQNRLSWIISRTPGKIEQFKKERAPTLNTFYSIKEIISLPDIILLTVSDSSVEICAEELSKKFGDRLKRKIIIHTSGILPLSVLDSCVRFGAITAAAHPYQTFYEPSPEILNDIAWGVEAGENYPLIEGFIKSLGGTPVNLENIDIHRRALYHCSAVVASNFLNILISSSKQIARDANLPPEIFIPPIVNTTLDNNLKNLSSGSEMPLTGPYARGDSKTIKMHLEALKQFPDMNNIYCYLALAATESALKSGFIDGNKYQEIKSLLTGNII